MLRTGALLNSQLFISVLLDLALMLKCFTSSARFARNRYLDFSWQCIGFCFCNLLHMEFFLRNMKKTNTFSHFHLLLQNKCIWIFAIFFAFFCRFAGFIFVSIFSYFLYIHFLICPEFPLFLILIIDLECKNFANFSRLAELRVVL